MKYQNPTFTVPYTRKYTQNWAATFGGAEAREEQEPIVLRVYYWDKAPETYKNLTAMSSDAIYVVVSSYDCGDIVSMLGDDYEMFPEEGYDGEGVYIVYGGAA